MRTNPYASSTKVRACFQTKGCLHPLSKGGNCEGIIVRAHSVRRGADLGEIARDGHVYQLRTDFEILSRTNGRAEAKLVGINEASTFNGFCARHDLETFRPLETVTFSGSQEQCFLLFYRAWAKETYTKQAALNAVEIYRSADKGRSIPEQIGIQSFISNYEEGLRFGMDDVNYYKNILDNALLSKDYGIVKSHVIWFKSPPDILCSGATYPYWDFEGGELQRFNRQSRTVPLALSILASPTGSVVVISWLRDLNEAPSKFFESLIKQKRMGDALVRFVFSAFENVFARPTWWEALPEGYHDRLIDLQAGYMSPIISTKPSHLVDDEYIFTKWQLSDFLEA